MIPLVIRGGLVFTQNAAREVVTADVLVKDGKIAAIGENLPADGAVKAIDARGLFVVPGFVQAHIHLTQTLCRGLADDRELLPWLKDRIWPLEAAHSAETSHTAARVGIAELLTTGTTTILDMGTTQHHDAIFEAARDMGLRYYGGKALMDQGEGAPKELLEDTDTALRTAEAQKQRWHDTSGGRVNFVYAPRFILSCTDALMRKVAERSRADRVLIHTHASENKGEIEVVKQITGHQNLRALHELGCLHAGTVVAHGVWIDESEEACLVASGAAICHCPGSNLKLASGVADVPRLLKKGVRVGLGADGAACDNTLDQRVEMRLAALLHRLQHGPTGLSAQAVLDLATIGGAAALGIAHAIGSLEPGKRADIVCLDPGFALPSPDPVSALVHGATAANVRHVFVDGIARVSDGELLDVSLPALMADAARDQRRLVERARIAR
ncbi:MAG: amidohydrolase family protein [Deltaproteobacteria bacterium]|nr:amidohydrolase family protein [Deltaproteobacteria bacterium]